ncbi:hypothetical protein AB67_4573 [Escherichia coli 5-366-08_S1_C3]|nr:hypothetical protein AB67_4573 [Escherichia coli 5-366-08_S1_C3]
MLLKNGLVITQDGLLLLIKRGHIYRKETTNNKDELWVL